MLRAFGHYAAEGIGSEGLGVQRAVALVVQHDDPDSASAWRDIPCELSLEPGEQFQDVLDGFRVLQPAPNRLQRLSSTLLERLEDELADETIASRAAGVVAGDSRLESCPLGGQRAPCSAPVTRRRSQPPTPGLQWPLSSSLTGRASRRQGPVRVRRIDPWPGLPSELRWGDPLPDNLATIAIPSVSNEAFSFE